MPPFATIQTCPEGVQKSVQGCRKSVSEIICTHASERNTTLDTRYVCEFVEKNHKTMPGVPDMAVRHIAMRPKPKVKVNSREGGGKGKPRPSTGVRRKPPGAQKQQPASIAINGDAARRLLESKFAANISSFNELKLHPDVRAVLPDVIQLPEHKQDQDIKPSIIQSLAVKIMRQSYTYKQRVKNEGEEPTVEKIPVDRQKTFVLAAQTGSGKTLAYLLPLLSDLKDQEKFPSWQLEKHYKTVRSVILVPTLELSQQVGQVLKQFEEPLGIKTFASAFGQSHQEIAKAFNNRLDVLVTTPKSSSRLERRTWEVPPILSLTRPILCSIPTSLTQLPT